MFGNMLNNWEIANEGDEPASMNYERPKEVLFEMKIERSQGFLIKDLLGKYFRRIILIGPHPL